MAWLDTAPEQEINRLRDFTGNHYHAPTGREEKAGKEHNGSQFSQLGLPCLPSAIIVNPCKSRRVALSPEGPLDRVFSDQEQQAMQPVWACRETADQASR